MIIYFTWFSSSDDFITIYNFSGTPNPIFALIKEEDETALEKNKLKGKSSVDERTLHHVVRRSILRSCLKIFPGTCAAKCSNDWLIEA